MDLALTAVEGLRQIYELVDAIRRQRSQNRKTYMRMMQIYVELQSEPVRANPTLQRSQAIEKFAYAVAMFYDHLQKYHDMHRVVRIFKWAKMEDSRLEVVEEVDKLFQMLNLATTVAVMEGNAAAASNSRKLFAKLEDIHSGIRLTHDQIHAALLADKQQFPVVKRDIVGRGLTRQGPLRSYGRIVLGKKLSMRDEDVERPEDEFEPEGKTPVVVDECTAEEWMGPKALPLIQKIELAELNQLPVNDEEEEKEPSEASDAADKEEEEGEEILEEKKQQQDEEPIEQEPEQHLAVDFEVENEEKEQCGLESVVLNTDDKEEEVVEEEKEPQEKEQPISWEPVLQVEDESVAAQHGIDDVVENQQGVDLEVQLSAENQQQQEEKIDPLAQVDEKETDLELDLVCNGVGEVAVEYQQEVDEEKIEPLALDVDEMEAANPTLSPQLSSSRLLDDSSVPLLIKLLGSGEATTQEKEQALLDLIGKCVSNSNRVQVYKTKGIPVLRNVVRTMREEEFEELQTCVREPTHSELLSLLHELQHGDEQEKEVAALRCSCLATRGDGEALRRIGALPLLIDLLTNGSANQKLWAAEALVTLASDSDENCVAITSEGGIPPLVALLRSGTDMQKQEAAYALGNLAANNETARAKIAREGAIPPMVEFMKAEADSQNQGAISALGFLSLENEENQGGTDKQKEEATHTLEYLTEEDQYAFSAVGIMTPLYAME
eukprot:jgi/Phyca11/535074/estExt2_fgenesh1_pg.C_PHYCAscaffold_310065